VSKDAKASPAGKSARRLISTSSEALPHPVATVRGGAPIDLSTTAQALLPGESRPRGGGLPDAPSPRPTSSARSVTLTVEPSGHGAVTRRATAGRGRGNAERLDGERGSQSPEVDRAAPSLATERTASRAPSASGPARPADLAAAVAVGAPSTATAPRMAAPASSPSNTLRSHLPTAPAREWAAGSAIARNFHTTTNAPTKNWSEAFDLTAEARAPQPSARTAAAHHSRKGAIA
jgi:hypothetical protein